MSEPVSASNAHIEALIEAGGQIMIGTAKPIVGAAVAHDGKKTLVLLKRSPGEPLHNLLGRLDSAIDTAQRTGSPVDEINPPGADWRYAYKNKK
jgi:hypothetical protein